MRQIFKVLLMVFGLGHLFSCGQSNHISVCLDNDKILSQDGSSIFAQWLMDNGLKAGEFAVSESLTVHSGEFSVIVAARHIQSIRTKGVDSLKRITLKNNPLNDLTALTDWPNLKTIDFEGKLSDLSAPMNREISQLSGPFELQIAEAEYLKASYLNNSEFIEILPKSVAGKARGVSKKINSHFDLHSDPKVSGHINIKALNGLMRLPVTKTKDLLQYERTIVMRGKITVQQGQLTIYSPIEEDFWEMAKLFVDTSINQRPKDRDDLILKGFTVNRITSGEPQEFSANLVPMAGIYFLLLGSDQDQVTGVHLEFE